MTLTPGTALGPYRIVSLIGSGGMGAVYRARDPRLDRDVAVKVLPEAMAGDSERLRLFEREARTCAAINHPNVIAVYDVGVESGRHYLVSELLEGTSLRGVLGMTGVPTDRALAIGSAVARGLEAAHEKGVVHRDLKPENIFVTREGRVKVLDFGLAKAPLRARFAGSDEETAPHHTIEGRIMGSAAYMSPEQVRGDALDARSDLFSFGIVLYEILTGRRPFHGDTPVEMMTAILRDEPRPLLPARASSALEVLVRRCLEKEIGRRFQSAHELVRALETLRVEPGARVTTSHSSGVGEPPPSRKAAIGRDGELRFLEQAFAEARSGNGVVVAIAGEPGVGKTILVDEFLGRIAKPGLTCTMARGRCSERLAGAEAYLPIIEALADLAGGDPRGSVAATVAEVAPTWHAQIGRSAGGADVKAASQERLKKEIRDLLAQISRDAPLVLFLDDVHWADPSTVDLLGFLAERLGTRRILVIVTFRPTDVRLADHPFGPLKVHLQSRGLLREIELGFWSESEVAAYLRREFEDHALPRDFAGLIHRQTEGSPLFVADLVRYLRNTGAIRREGEVYSLAEPMGGMANRLPESVRSMILRKIEQLDEEERALLTAASVQGVLFDSAVLSEALDLDGVTVEERCASLESVHAFIRKQAEQDLPDRRLNVRYRFVHVLYQNALYAAMTPTRRAALSGRVAEAWAKAMGTRQAEIAPELAALFEAARAHERAIDALILAARRAGELFATREAQALVRRGLTLLDDLPDTEENLRREMTLRLMLAPLLSPAAGWTGSEIEAALTRARDLARQLQDADAEFPALWGMFAGLFVLPDFDAASAVIADLRTLGEKRGNRVSLLHAFWAEAATDLYQGRLGEAAVKLDRAAALYDPVADRGLAQVYAQDPCAGVLAYRAVVEALRGDPELAALSAERAVATARGTAHPFSIAYALILGGCVADQFLGAWESLDERLAEARSLCSEHGFGLFRLQADILHGWRAVHLGVPTGLAEVREGLSQLESLPLSLMRPYFIGLFADAQLRMGRGEEALGTARRGLRTIERTRQVCYRPALLVLEGEALLGLGELGGAGRSFAEALEVATAHGNEWYGVRAAVCLAGLRRREGRREEAEEIEARAWKRLPEGRHRSLRRSLQAVTRALLP